MFVRMSLTPGMPVPSSVAKAPPAAALPVRSIPGSHGWPVLGPIKDRLEYFWFQGPETFFRKRIEANNSTVFRTNVPPTFPLFTGVNPNVVAVLDCKSFAHMFDMDLVDKRDVLVGDFMPSVSYTGDIRVCAYLDTSEPQHPKVKNFAMDILKRSSKTWVSDMTASLDTMWESLESSLTTSSSGASYFLPLQKALFTFLSKCIVGADPASDPDVSSSGHIMLDKWLAVQLLPTVNIGIAQPLEELFLHSFSYPFALVSGDYKKLYNFVNTHGSATVDRGVTDFGLTREEAIHNIIFILGFNAFGGFTVFLPSLLAQLAADTTGLQAKLRKEVKELGGSGDLTFESVKSLELTESVVYEALRFKPPVPLQFGRARKDFRLSSHESAFDVKKGELLCGFQMLVMRDPKVFDDPETFKPDRFTGSGKGMLDYLYWSNGPQTGTPAEGNKQCAGKDVVTMTATLFLAHMFRRYESITFGSSSITALEKPK